MKFMGISKICTTKFGLGWSNSQANISVLDWFRGEKVVLLDVPDLARHFCCEQLLTQLGTLICLFAEFRKRTHNGNTFFCDGMLLCLVIIIIIGVVCRFNKFKTISGI